MSAVDSAARALPYWAVLSGPKYLWARPPERDYDFDSDGVRLRLHEWGDPGGVPIVLCHGGWDHAHGFDLLAPFLADDYRLIAIDARGHGDSAWVDSYPYPHDVHDVMRVLRRVGRAHLLELNDALQKMNGTVTRLLLRDFTIWPQ